MCQEGRTRNSAKSLQRYEDMSMWQLSNLLEVKGKVAFSDGWCQTTWKWMYMFASCLNYWTQMHSSQRWRSGRVLIIETVGSYTEVENHSRWGMEQKLDAGNRTRQRRRLERKCRTGWRRWDAGANRNPGRSRRWTYQTREAWKQCHMLRLFFFLDWRKNRQNLNNRSECVSTKEKTWS